MVTFAEGGFRDDLAELKAALFAAQQALIAEGMARDVAEKELARYRRIADGQILVLARELGIVSANLSAAHEAYRRLERKSSKELRKARSAIAAAAPPS